MLRDQIPTCSGTPAATANIASTIAVMSNIPCPRQWHFSLNVLHILSLSINRLKNKRRAVRNIRLATRFRLASHMWGRLSDPSSDLRSPLIYEALCETIWTEQPTSCAYLSHMRPIVSQPSRLTISGSGVLYQEAPSHNLGPIVGLLD